MTDLTRTWRHAGVMTAGTALSRLTGLVRVAALTYALGVTGTKLADTYNLANTTPNIVYELFLGGILTSVFVPVLIDSRERSRRDESALISVSLLALAVVAAIAGIAAPFIMRIYTFRIADPELRRQQLELATYLLRWFAPQIFFYGVSAIAQALLNVRDRFAAPAFAPVLNNVVVAGTFVAYGRLLGEQGLELTSSAKVLLGAGTTAGVVLQALVLLPFVRGEGLRARFDFTDPAVRRVMRLAMYVITYVVINQIALWVVLALANGVRGGVTAWSVAFWFMQFPHGLLAVSVVTALVPQLSRAAGADWGAFRDHFATGLRAIVYLVLPAAVGYAILAHPIARVLLARGVATVRDANAVADVLQVFAVSLVFFSTFQLLTRSFYALPDTRTPAALNAVAVAVNVAIDLPLFAWLGVRGLALGHAISYAFAVVLLSRVLDRRVPGGLRLRTSAAPLMRTIAITAGMAGCVWALARITDGNDVVQVGVCASAGAILYLAFSQVAGLEERNIVLGLIRRRDRGGSE